MGKDESPSEKMEREMEEKTPTEAIRDDLGGSPEPTDEQEEALKEKVEDKRSERE